MRRGRKNGEDVKGIRGEEKKKKERTLSSTLQKKESVTAMGGENRHADEGKTGRQVRWRDLKVCGLCGN